MEQKNKSLESSNQETSTNLMTDEEELDYYEDDELPPAMPEQLPSLIRLLVSRTPKIYKPTVAQAVFPSLAAHLYKVKFRYIDNVDHEATLMNVLMAPTGTGKSCINAPINHIMADIRERDRVNMDREREWREQMSTMGTHKYKPARPKNLVIQDIDPNMTMAAFALRSVEAKGHFLYSQMNEIDQRVECPEATRLLEQLSEECRDIAILSQDRIYENFTFRALVIAYLKACVLYVANGCKWEAEMDEFIRWSLHYDLWCKMRFFYDLAKEQQEEANRIGERGPKNLLQQLPDEFTWGQVESARIDNGMDIAGTREMIKTWMKRGYLLYDRVSVKTLFRKESFVR